MQGRTILLTGATGYIGSHTWCALVEAGFSVIGLDNFSNSSPQVLSRIEKITGIPCRFIEGDVRDRVAMERVLAEHRVDAAIHFAASKAVGESVQKPLEYYENNVGGLIALVAALRAAGVKPLVFSSSATVYGDPQEVPIRESFPLGATSPYGQTKLIGEQLLGELQRAEPDWRIGVLRYFNPVGAHASGLIGEDPRGIPNNLMPYVAQVAVGSRAKLTVFGGDYPTPDGTGVRDYIHVEDLARGHVAALERLLTVPGGFTVNLGTGQGYSVLQVIQAYERASGRPIAYEIGPRRQGDVTQCYADPALAKSVLGWAAQRDLDRMCADSWNWQRTNPRGYECAA